MPKITKTLYVKIRIAWRTWLEMHHVSAMEIWLISFKKHSSKVMIPYHDAVEEQEI
jgi:hypothetical protein